MAKTFKTNQTLVNSGFNQLSGETLVLYGNTFIGSTGTFQYCTNQHNNYTAYSVADASYVTGQTSCIRHIGSNEQVIFRDISGITGATYLIYNKLLPSLVFGTNNCAQSIDSTIIGGRNNYILSGNTGSTIIGGRNNYILSGNTGSTIIGGNNIILSGITYPNTVIVPNLAIWETPQGSGNLLGWNNITKRVYLTTASGGTIINSCVDEIIFNNGTAIVGTANLKYCCAIDALQIGTNSCATGTTSVALAGGGAFGCCSVAFGGNTYGIESFALGGGTAACCDYSIAIGSGAIAQGLQSVAMNGGTTYGQASFAFGGATACGFESFAFGGASCAVCDGGIAFGNGNISCSQYAAAIAGSNNVLSSGNTNSVLLGGVGITIEANCLPNTVIVPNLAIITPPIGSGSMLCWNPSTCVIEQTTGSGGITGATNLGNGNGTIFTSISGNSIQLKSLSGGTNVNITCNANYIAISTTKNCINAYSAITTGITLTTGSSYVVLIGFSSAMSINLPANPLDGQTFKIKDMCGCAYSKNITICGNGNNIDGFVCALINTDYGSVELLYSSSPIAGWYSLAFIN